MEPQTYAGSLLESARMTTAGSPSSSSRRCRRATTGSRHFCRSARTTVGDGRWSTRPRAACRRSRSISPPEQLAWPCSSTPAPGARVVGLDLTEAMLREGKRRVSAAGRQDSIGLVLGNADRLPFPDASFDALCFTYLLRYVPDPGATLSELARVVRPGGVVASLEFMRPPSRSGMRGGCSTRASFCRSAVSSPGGRPGSMSGGSSVPNISEHYRRYPLEQIVALWQKAGIDDVGTRLMSLGGGLVMWGRRTGG